MNRRHDVGELDGLERIDQLFMQLDLVARLEIEAARILYPVHERLVDRQVTLDRVAQRYHIDVLRRQRLPGQQAKQQQIAGSRERVHRSSPFGTSGGPPRRQ